MNSGRNADHVAKVTLGIVLAGVALNLLYNLIWIALGGEFPYTNFLFRTDDRFADFFKLLIYFGDFGGRAIAHGNALLNVDQLLADFAEQARHFGRGSPLNPFHLPPLAMALAMGFRRLIELVNPALVLLSLIALYLTVLTTSFLRIAPSRQALWVMAALCSYPVLFTIDRANVYSAIIGLCLVAGLYSSAKGRVTPLALLLVAIALNLRPNACFFPLAMFLAGMGWRLIDGIKLAILTLAIALVAYVAAQAALPQYTPDAIRSGLADYHKMYVLGNLGIAYGSSLLGAMKAFFGTPAQYVMLPPMVGIAIILGSSVLRQFGRLDPASFLFALASAYVTMSQVTSDYHLFIFFLPLLVLASQGGPRDQRYWTVLAGSAAMLIPKNYLFHQGDYVIAWSYQVVLNPLIMLGCTFFLLAQSLRRESARPAIA